MTARGWGAWLVGCLVMVFAVPGTFGPLVVLVGAACVATTGERERAFIRALIFGSLLLLMRVIFGALTGHTGGNVLFSLPTLDLPRLLGGTTFGGPVSSDALVFALNQGVRLLAMMGCFGAFASVAAPSQLIRLVPRFLFEAGLVVNIALAFAPKVVSTTVAVTEAQRMRGIARTGLRRLAPTLSPVLATALDSSIQLAESMDARGYGRRLKGHPNEGRLRLSLIACVLVTTASFAAVAGGDSSGVLVAAMVLSMVVTIGVLRAMSKLSVVTSYATDRWTREDIWVGAVVGTAALLQLALPLDSSVPKEALQMTPTISILLGASTCLPALLRVVPAAPKGEPA